MSIFNRDNRNDKSGDILPPEPAKTAVPKPAPPQTQTIEQTVSAAPTPAATTIPKPSPTPARTGASMASVISKALKITGELESTEDIQIDGQIEGDVRGVGVKIGQNAKVKGTVYGDEVELAGTIEGRIEAKKVILSGTARMTGDIWHQEIKVEAGAYISGNLKPELGKSDGKSAAAKPAASASVSPLTPGNAGAAAHH